MINPLVSVLISAYNHEKYVQTTIRSIIAQTYKNIELFIIDDGSTDSTWQKIKEMDGDCRKRFTHVYFETKENEGTCKTINRMLENANGKYIYMIASDDVAKAEAIQKEVVFLEENLDYALVVGNNEFIDLKGNVCYWDKNKEIVYNLKKAKYKTFVDFLQKDKRIDFTKEDFGSYETLFFGNYIPNGNLIRKEIIEKIGYFTKDAPLEDWYLMLQISKYTKMKYLDEILFSYRWYENNTIKQTDKIKRYIKQTKEHEKELLNCLKDEDILPGVVYIKNLLALKKKRLFLPLYYIKLINNYLKRKGIRKTFLICLKKLI